MKELIVRTISGLLYVAIIVFSMYTSHEWLMVLFLSIAAITLTEFLRLVHLKSYLAFVLLLVLMYFLSYNIFDVNAIYLYLILSCFVNLFLLKDVLWTTKIPIFEKKKFLTVIFYVISGFVFLTLIPFQQNEFYPKLIIGVFILIWSNDCMAYLIGKNFGKHKLIERISPNKTVEGFLGGIVGSLLAAFIIFNFTELYDLWVWICLALIASLFGTIGDLIQSKFKRQAGVKDSGSIMPGHGGLYDRLDSIMYASPFLYAFLLIVDYVS
jgi:phosphatidate cytidylyltransferase